MADAGFPITIDVSRCNGCGVCANICHERAMRVQHGKIAIDAALCSTCSQCIAMCPERALGWCGVPASPHDPRQIPTASQLDELFKERRSVRAYTPERLARSELEAIATCAAYAPTNNYDFRLVIVDDPARLQALEELAHSMVRGIYRLVYKHRILFELLTRVPFATRPSEKDRVKIVGTVEQGHTVFHAAPALLLVIGDARVALSTESAQYALANVIYAAEVRGIASSLSGAAKLLLGRNPHARKLLGLRRNERIYGCLTLGKAAVQFKNNVEGRRLPIRWNGAETLAE